MVIGCEVTVQDFDASKDEGLLEQCHRLCREVFDQEYGLKESLQNIDKNKNSRYIVAQWIGDGSVIATCRLCSIHPYVKLEQVAVCKVCFTFITIFSCEMKFLIPIKLINIYIVSVIIFHILDSTLSNLI